MTAAAQPGFADLVEKVRPAVVSVRVKSQVQPVDNSGAQFFGQGFDQLPDGHPLKRFFRDFGFGPQGEKQRPEQRKGKRGEGRPGHARPVSQGSGFFISEDGYVVTNNHVVNFRRFILSCIG